MYNQEDVRSSFTPGSDHGLIGMYRILATLAADSYPTYTSRPRVIGETRLGTLRNIILRNKTFDQSEAV